MKRRQELVRVAPQYYQPPAQPQLTNVSLKHLRFVSQPMNDKPVTELAGIGEVLGGRLQSKGFSKASMVLQQFVGLNKDKSLFIQWRQASTGANIKQAGDCYLCLSDYCNKFL
jgi:hypothetical protein